MLVNSTSLAALRVGFKTIFQDALKLDKSAYDRIAETVPSTAKEEKYGWLGELPGMREWIGPRIIHNLSEHDYSIKNRDFELTVQVDRSDIEDDTLGTYNPRFKALGRAVARHPDQMVFAALKAGFTQRCYDGQNFFDTDHPVIAEDGTVVSVSNTDGGNGTPWFLLATNEVIKPLIFQERKKPEFVYKDDPKDENVFNNRKFVYGVDSRHAVGYGFWQMAWGSKQELTAANYAKARAGIGGMKGDFGQPLAITPNLLVVPPSLEGAARRLLNNQFIDGGNTNEWQGTAELLVVNWLA